MVVTLEEGRKSGSQNGAITSAPKWRGERLTPHSKVLDAFLPAGNHCANETRCGFVRILRVLNTHRISMLHQTHSLHATSIKNH